jgi:hypothetical protein
VPIRTQPHDLGSFWSKKQDTLLARCRIRDGEIREVSFVPGRISEKNQAAFLKPADAQDVVKHTQEISARFGTRFDVSEEDVLIRT